VNDLSGSLRKGKLTTSTKKKERDGLGERRRDTSSTLPIKKRREKAAGFITAITDTRRHGEEA